jgi:peroxiredoxin
MRIFLMLCAAVSTVVLFNPSAWSIEPGHPAPYFELPGIDGGYTESARLFAAHEMTFLVFWDSGCAHCVESLERCEAFDSEYGGASIAVVGVNTDADGELGARGALEESGAAFPQLLDRGGGVAGLYGVPLASFAVYLIDSRGIVIDVGIDPPGDVHDFMERMLEAPVPAVYRADARAENVLGLGARGDARIRFIGIDTRGNEPVGPYGERARSGNHLQYRFTLEMMRRLGRYLTIGALLRISNEVAEVLESGPEYLGSEWGSAFALFSRRRFSLRIGYYVMHMTPLTMMRWDWDDNPRIGGDTGCGCGPAAGVLLIESLERLGPDLTFEGAQAAYVMPDFEIGAFYGMPRRAREVHVREYSASGELPRYSLEIYGAEAKLQRYDQRTGRFWRVGAHFLGSWENNRSVDFAALGYSIPQPWQESTILSVSWEAPFLPVAAIRGEWILSNRTEDHIYGIDGERQDFTSHGGGGTAGILVEWEHSLRFSCDYIRLEPAFNSPFAALSYEANREGIRGSVSAYIAEEAVVASVFYRRTSEIEPPEEGVEKERISLFGASLDLDFTGGLGGSVGFIDKESRRDGGLEAFDAARRAIVMSIRYLFLQSASLEIRHERIDSESDATGILLESETKLYGLYLSARF